MTIRTRKSSSRQCLAIGFAVDRGAWGDLSAVYAYTHLGPWLINLIFWSDEK